jgi:tetratricopeptide (TPR) repeat protein
MTLRRSAFALLLCGLAFTGCTNVRLNEDSAGYERELVNLHRRLLEHPDDAGVLRDIGVIYVRTAEYAKGQEYLQRAFSREPADGETLFYLGVASEMTARNETALRFYEKYADVPRVSQYRRLMQGRYNQLVKVAVREEARSRAAMDAEAADVAPTSDDIVAVFPLSYRSTDSQYAPLGRGLAEMVAVDLSSIRGIRVVERVRLQALLDELRLGQGGAVDPSTAPRVGRLLGAGRVIGGTYSVAGQNDLQMGAAVVRTGGEVTGEVSASGELGDLFRVEKELVFDLVEALDIDLSPAERDAIETVPTQNLQAFLLYSRGLEQEDAGAFSEAAQLYGRAAQIDPAFARAVDATERVESMEAAGTVGEALSSAGVTQRPGVSESLIMARVQNLNASIGAHVVPGPAMRVPAQEVLVELPPPPPPPD